MLCSNGTNDKYKCWELPCLYLEKWTSLLQHHLYFAFTQQWCNHISDILIYTLRPTFSSVIILLISQYSCCSDNVYATCMCLHFASTSLHCATVVFNKTVKGEQHPTCPLKPFLLSVIDSFFCLRSPLGMLVFISWLHLARLWRHLDTHRKTCTQAQEKQMQRIM